MDLNNFEFQTNKRFHGGYLLTRKAENVYLRFVKTWNFILVV